ncbi:MAG: hypothetical protein WC236_07410 [Gallionellaceae bacterium]|jgi:hypothetical protein
MPNKQRNRARNLDDKAIEEIVKIIDGWQPSKLTWELLIEQILLRLRDHYTRQALYNHTRIKEAFAARKKGLSEHYPLELSSLPPENQHIIRLETEIERLKLENNNLLEQFNRWVYNGYLKQMDERMRNFMNQPLPSVNRHPSEKPSLGRTRVKRK